MRKFILGSLIGLFAMSAFADSDTQKYTYDYDKEIDTYYRINVTTNEVENLIYDEALNGLYRLNPQTNLVELVERLDNVASSDTPKYTYDYDKEIDTYYRRQG